MVTARKFAVISVIVLILVMLAGCTLIQSEADIVVRNDASFTIDVDIDGSTGTISSGTQRTFTAQ